MHLCFEEKVLLRHWRVFSWSSLRHHSPEASLETSPDLRQRCRDIWSKTARWHHGVPILSLQSVTLANCLVNFPETSLTWILKCYCTEVEGLVVILLVWKSTCVFLLCAHILHYSSLFLCSITHSSKFFLWTLISKKWQQFLLDIKIKNSVCQCLCVLHAETCLVSEWIYHQVAHILVDSSSIKRDSSPCIQYPFELCLVVMVARIWAWSWIMTPSSLKWRKVELLSLGAVRGKGDKHPLCGSHLA